MGSLEKVTTRRGAREVGRRRAQAARLRRAGRLRDRAEDRRARPISLVYEDGVLRPRRDARRRRARRGRDREPAHDRRRSRCGCVADGEARRRCSRCAARSTCRSPASARFNERLVGGGQERRRRTRATPPPARCASSTPRITAERPLSIWIYGVGAARGRSGARRTARRSRGCASAASARIRSPSGSSRSRRSPRPAARGSAAAPSSTTRSTAIVIKVDSLDQQRAARRAARAAALGARLQVGAD